MKIAAILLLLANNGDVQYIHRFSDSSACHEFITKVKADDGRLACVDVPPTERKPKATK